MCTEKQPSSESYSWLERAVNEGNVGKGTGTRPAPIAQGPPLPVDTLLDVAIQIADGLDAAHQKGITHRDH